MKADSLSKIIIVTIFIPALTVFSQQSNLSKAVNLISEYIASDYFKELKNNSDDLALVDSIFLKAVEFTNGDYSEALLCLTLSTIPYRQVPMIIPIFRAKIYYPLISADEKVFKIKNLNLPKYFFYDSPGDEYGDKDKLAHYFGNAFIRYSLDILDLSFLIGYFVEEFEENFTVNSTINYRDIEANWYGDVFGSELKQNRRILPSSILLHRSLRYIIISL